MSVLQDKIFFGFKIKVSQYEGIGKLGLDIVYCRFFMKYEELYVIFV